MSLSSAQVAVASNAATEICEGLDSAGTSIDIRNTDAAITVYLGGSAVTVDTGMPLKAGESISLVLRGSSDALYGLAASSTVVVALLRVGRNA